MLPPSPFLPPPRTHSISALPPVPSCSHQDSPHLCPAPQSLPLISASRWLLKRGELFVVEETGLFRKLASRPTCYLFLFNDVLVVTKKKRWVPALDARLHGPGMRSRQQPWPWSQGGGLGPALGSTLPAAWPSGCPQTPEASGQPPVSLQRGQLHGPGLCPGGPHPGPEDGALGGLSAWRRQPQLLCSAPLPADPPAQQ